MERAETISCREVAYALGVTPMKVKIGIQNGTLPIGTVMRADGSTKHRIVIIKARFEAWLRGDDLKCHCPYCGDTDRQGEQQ